MARPPAAGWSKKLGTKINEVPVQHEGDEVHSGQHDDQKLLSWRYEQAKVRRFNVITCHYKVGGEDVSMRVPVVTASLPFRTSP